MTRKQATLILIGVAAGVVVVVTVFFQFSFNYARMKKDEAIHRNQVRMPEMPLHTVPVDGGTDRYKIAELKNPFPMRKKWIAEGKTAYGYYCGQCHGPGLNGRGTVGQSFAPLPTDLTARKVQSQTDGALFRKISFGFLRHPPLSNTVSVEDRWKILLLIRSAGNRQ